MNDPCLFVVSAPVEHVGAVREAIHGAGGGKMGNYSNCSFSYRGTGRFMPEPGANPSIGEVGKLVEIEEERIEVLCERSNISAVIDAVKKVHPYETPALHYFSVVIE